MQSNSVICFHNPDEENGYLSNWYLSDFKINGIIFTSMEQYMMYQKAVVFDDKVVAEEILAASDVAEIKALGRKVSNYDDIVWNGVRQIIVYRGLLEKFCQNKELAGQLLATGDSILAECAVKDRIWGIGLSMRDNDRFDMKKWKGQNLLGFALMEVRKCLAKELGSMLREKECVEGVYGSVSKCSNYFGNEIFNINSRNVEIDKK